jgi:hypothetical protein
MAGSTCARSAADPLCRQRDRAPRGLIGEIVARSSRDIVDVRRSHARRRARRVLKP